jgi:hypothetical protein
VRSGWRLGAVCALGMALVASDSVDDESTEIELNREQSPLAGESELEGVTDWGERRRRRRAGVPEFRILALPCPWLVGCALCAAIVFLLGTFVGDLAQNVCVPGRCGIPMSNATARPAPSPSTHGGGMGSMGGHGHGGHEGGAAAAPPTVPPGKLSKARAVAARQAALELRALLEKYYGSHSEAVLVKAWGVPPGSKDSYHGWSTMVATFGRALVSDSQDRFIVGAIGSSVTAGHDNCNYDSYEKQLSRTLGPVFAAAGTPLEVQNAGEGGGCGDSYRNQVFCVKHNVSPLADIVHYSWTYFENDARTGADQHESLVRWLQKMERRAPLHLLNMGGDSSTGCYQSRVPGSLGARLFAAYESTGFNAFCLVLAIEDALGAESPGKKWGAVGDGLHNATRYGELETDPLRKDSTGVMFRNWHPGPLGFQTVADALSYSYAGFVVDALDQVLAALAAGKDPRALWPVGAPAPLPQPPLSGCDPRYCDAPRAPECLNFEEPTYGVPGVAMLVATDAANPYKGLPQLWTRWRNEETSPLVPKFEQVFYKNDPKKCEHFDHCGGIKAASPDAGWLVFKLPPMSAGLVVLCGCCGEDVAKRMFIENDDLEVVLDGVKLDRATFAPAAELNKCAAVAQALPVTQKPRILGLRVKPGATANTEVSISHVFVL